VQAAVPKPRSVTTSRPDEAEPFTAITFISPDRRHARSSTLYDAKTAFADLVSLRGRMAEDERRETQLKQFLQQTMGEASRARFETGEVSWKRAKDSVVLDVVTLLKEQPDLVQRYPLNKRGSRRFLIA